MYSESQYSELVATMTEAEARRIESLLCSDILPTLTDAEKAALIPAYLKAYHRLHRLSQMTEVGAALCISAPSCYGCLRSSCICASRRAHYKGLYGASWCGCCGQDYSDPINNTLFVSGGYKVVEGGKRQTPDGVLYEKVGRLWVRVPCASCSPAYVEVRENAVEGILEEEEFERREAISWAHERRC